MNQNILITGAGKGFGRLTAETLLKAKYNVFASMREANGRNAENAAALKKLGAEIVEIDVTDDNSVETGVADVLKQAKHIDVLINNAGVGAIGWQEAFTIEDWQRIFDLNVFGVQRMNRAVLPHMRERYDGLIIHVSSLLGRFCLPFFGPYNASKHALEALADNYRVELSGAGIESIIVEPGAYGTSFQTSLVHSSDKQRAESYGEFAEAPQKQMMEFEKNFEEGNAPDPQMVADAVLNLIELPRGRRPFRTIVEGMGMGEPIEKYNQAASQMTTSIYSAIGIDKMLKVM